MYHFANVTCATMMKEITAFLVDATVVTWKMLFHFLLIMNLMRLKVELQRQKDNEAF